MLGTRGCRLGIIHPEIYEMQVRAIVRAARAVCDLGFSRDDVESGFLNRYLEQRIVDRSPFDTIDKPGVGWLVRLAAWTGREAKHDLKLGVCGEHGGDPDSIAFFHDAGIDYVSCSPFRVPIARVAAAQAALAAAGSA